MFENMNPLNKSLAWLEIFLLMFGAFLIGYFFARWYYKNKLNKAKDEFEEEIRQLKLENLENSESNIPRGIKAVKTRNRKGELIQPTESEPEVKEDIEEPILNFDTIGIETEENKDDLKLINGIGPFIEKKLNSIGIYSFSQISNWSENDIEDITKRIKFFPGRIARDNWVGQAKELKK